MAGDTSSTTTTADSSSSSANNEGADKPPSTKTTPTGVAALPEANGPDNHYLNQHGVPIPPSDALSHEKSPGYTRGSLSELVRKEGGKEAAVLPDIMATSAAIVKMDPAEHPHPHHSHHHLPHLLHFPHIHKNSSTATLGSEIGSVPPSPNPDKGIIGGVFRRKSSGSKDGKEREKFKAGMSQINGTKKSKESKEKGGEERISRAPSRASSIKSNKSGGGGDEDGGKFKYTLKDLLGSSSKLNRRGSQKSIGGSSRRSDSDYEHDGPEPSHSKVPRAPRSTGGESVGSLSQKYGVCGKVAIGKGATSVVRLAHKWDRTEEKVYAVKEFRKRRKNESEKEYVKKLTAEFCISSTLHHPNIVETVDLVQDENQKWCEVMEFCPGGDLYAAIKKGGMSPAEVECCFKQICSGVAYLHSQGVAHRDIKPENLFFDTKGRLKIGDYGASTVYRLPWEKTVHMSTGLCGSEPYIAPEQFLGRPYDARLVDIWAVAIVYYCLHFQELPWRAAQQTDEMYREYAAACHQFPLPATREQAEAAIKDGRDKHGSHWNAVPGCPPTINNLSPRACRPLIRHMLEPDPKKRATIEDVMSYTWYKAIPVCFEQEHPSHIHVNAQAMANTVVKEVWD